jgi:hypothetical protein
MIGNIDLLLLLFDVMLTVRFIFVSLFLFNKALFLIKKGGREMRRAVFGVDVVLKRDYYERTKQNEHVDEP